MTATRFPLCWPPGRPRTPAYKRTRAKFHTQTKRPSATNPEWVRTERDSVSLTRARDFLQAELDRLGAKAVILSTNLELRLDGLPRAGQRMPADPGAAVYFTHKGREMAFACDRWDRVEDNILAAAKTIEALRGIERWGTGDMVEAAFTGFTALPPARVAIRPWHEVLGVPSHASTDEARDAYRELSKKFHPDQNPGDDAANESYLEVQDAYQRFKKERGL